MSKDIPFSKPCWAGNEFAYVSDAMKAGHVSGDGPYTKQVEDFLARNLGANAVLLTTSCTHALEMAAILVDIKPGDEVIVPSYTFVSTALAFVMRGAKPVFVDIRPDTLNMDESQVEDLITERTRAILPVHYAGVGCEMDVLMAIAERHGVIVIEDNAHGLFGKYRDRPLGSIGHMSVSSFHATKNIICGEGGALVINDDRFTKRAEVIREKGTNRKHFFRGEVDKYTWVDYGSSYVMSDILAACLYAQLERYEEIQQQRREIWHYYHEKLGSWARENSVQLPHIPSHCAQAYHLYYLTFPGTEDQRRVLRLLQDQGVQATSHYQPLHSSVMASKLGKNNINLPVTDKVARSIVRLPLYNDLSRADQDSVISALQNVEIQ